MPFAGYKDFDECVRKNSNKSNPKAYCGKIKSVAEDDPMTQPNLSDWQTRTRIESPVVLSAFEETDGRMFANIRLLRAGTSKNRRTYPPHVVKEAVDKKLFDGVRMFINHDKKRPNPTERSLTEMVSAIESTSFDDAEKSMDGRVEFFSRDFYDYAQRAKDYMGVSINALVKGTRHLIGGEVHEDVSGWTLPRSVDWVTFPAAGGAILAFEDEDEETMIDWSKITVEELKKNNQEVFESIVTEAKAEVEREDSEDDDKKIVKPDGEKVLVSQESINDLVSKAVQSVLEDREKREKESADKKKTAGDLIRAAFEKSGLPMKTRTRVMAGFESSEEFDETAVAESIKLAKEELAAAGAGPIIHDMGPSGGTGGGQETAATTFSVHESVKDVFGIKKEAKKEPQEVAKEGTK